MGGGPEFGKTCLYNTCTLPYWHSILKSFWLELQNCRPVETPAEPMKSDHGFTDTPCPANQKGPRFYRYPSSQSEVTTVSQTPRQANQKGPRFYRYPPIQSEARTGCEYANSSHETRPPALNSDWLTKACFQFI